MTTHVPITVACPAAVALQAAYDTLLSFESVEDSYIAQNILTVYGVVQRILVPRRFQSHKNTDKMSQKYFFACLITAKPITSGTCELFVSANESEAGFRYNSASKTNEFLGELLRRFTQTLAAPQNK